MLALVMPAFAEGLPWECPAIVTVEDAAVYRNTDAGLLDAFAALESAARVYWDEGCAWVETTTDLGPTTTTERVCEGGGSTVTWTESSYHDFEGSRSEWLDTWAFVVEVPSGEPWSRIALAATDGYWSSSGLTYGGADTWSASWSGVFDGVPDDGWFEIDDGWSTSSGDSSTSRSIQTPACAWGWSDADAVGGEVQAERVRAPERTAEVVTTVDRTCGAIYSVASLDEVTVGAVDPATWARDLADADGDGRVAGDCDCDDADPSRHTSSQDHPNDGIDQDCDGADNVDWDLDDDGYDGVASGGDDCDDGDDDTFPGAEDVPDGVDQDCDGADDVDADEDGYSADGDRWPADCDDTDDDRYPGHTEVPCDGVDQNCDGEDSCPPPDAEPEDTADDEPPPAAAAEPGCAGGAAWLLLVPLAGFTRRRARGTAG